MHLYIEIGQHLVKLVVYICLSAFQQHSKNYLIQVLQSQEGAYVLNNFDKEKGYKKKRDTFKYGYQVFNILLRSITIK